MPDNLFLLFVQPLEAERIRYAVTGSVAGSAYGEPRMTNDIDIVVDISPDDVDRVARAFPISAFYFPPVEVVVVELRRAQRGHFNVIHHDTGFKADFYPKGRDATLGFPHPDLVIKNPSPYGVLIWPTYSDTSLTVSLYSTHWVDVQALGQDTSANGSCTVYLAKRQRTFLDGKVVNDATKAQYRASQGQNCGDAQAPPPTTPSTATPRVATVPPPTRKPGSTPVPTG